jgi:hypothetical protein
MLPPTQRGERRSSTPKTFFLEISDDPEKLHLQLIEPNYDLNFAWLIQPGNFNYLYASLVASRLSK